jgi:phosphomannomutase
VNNQTIGMVAQAFNDYLWHACNLKSFLKVTVGYNGRNCSQKFARIFMRALSGNVIITYLSEKITPTSILSLYNTPKFL